MGADAVLAALWPLLLLLPTMALAGAVARRLAGETAAIVAVAKRRRLTLLEASAETVPIAIRVNGHHSGSSWPVYSVVFQRARRL